MNSAEVASDSRQIPSRSFCDGKIAGLYDLEETLGSGHFAVVKLARHVFTGAKVAVKVVDKTKLDDVSKAHLFQEVRCMKLVQHPNVVRLYEVIDTQTKLYLVLELGDGGDLYDYIMKHEGGLNEKLACKYFRQILRAISYCHQLHVVHRDLKPENVVFFEKLGIVKLTDFGFSNKFSPGQKLETFCGSLAYSAPEILLGDSYDAPAVDIWSLGVILYMLVCGQPPFEKANDSETLTMIMDCKYTVPSQISKNCKQLIGSMLVRDPQKRATLDQIATDAWLVENSEPDVIDDATTPLVSRKEISETDHSFIIQKMINGKIASKEEILQSLDKNKYNHITATYFLLAELRLRKYHEEQKQTSLNASKRSNTDNANDMKIIPTTNKVAVPVSICPPTIYLTDTKPDKRNRKCSIVREEDEDESACENACELNKLKISVPRRESISDGEINKSVQDCSNTNIVVPIDLSFAQKMHSIEPYPNPMLSNTKAIMKDIDFVNKDEGLKQLEIGKFQSHSNSGKNSVLTHRKTKINKIRTPSCSSSEASDDDTKTRSKKKINKYVGDTPVRFRMHRRDSHDDSSDSQEQTFPPTGPHAQIGTVIPNDSNVDGKKDGQSQSRDNNKSEDYRKSSHSHNQKLKKQSREYNTDKHTSYEKTHNTNSSHGRRRRVRESQSLDRITESQEYELRYKNAGIVEAFAAVNEVSNSLVETKEEEYDENSIGIRKDSIQAKNLILNIMKETLHCRRSKSNLTHLGSMEEIDFILEEKSLMKTIQVTGTKCVVTLKKISRLGKYFPVVNFS